VSFCCRIPWSGRPASQKDIAQCRALSLSGWRLVLCCIALSSSVCSCYNTKCWFCRANLCVVRVAESSAYREGITKSIRSMRATFWLPFRQDRWWRSTGDNFKPNSPRLTLFPWVVTTAYPRNLISIKPLAVHCASCYLFVAIIGRFIVALAIEVMWFLGMYTCALVSNYLLLTADYSLWSVPRIASILL